MRDDYCKKHFSYFGNVTLQKKSPTNPSLKLHLQTQHKINPGLRKVAIHSIIIAVIMIAIYPCIVFVFFVKNIVHHQRNMYLFYNSCFKRIIHHNIRYEIWFKRTVFGGSIVYVLPAHVFAYKRNIEVFYKV